MVRPPAVAGQFYEGTKEGLKAQVERCIEPGAAKERVKGVLSPHAGLMYSGSVAGAVYSRLEFPRTFIIVGPNHTGLGARLSIMPEGVWEVPLADVEIDAALAASIAANCPSLTNDSLAHRYEHSIELQLPFITYFSPEARIVPICVMQGSSEDLIELGEAIAKAVKVAGYPVVVVASSDMSHFIPDALARQKDGMALEKVLALDPRGLFTTVTEYSISMCGFMPTTVVLSAAVALGAAEAKLVKYATSAEVSGDLHSVVGYASAIMK